MAERRRRGSDPADDPRDDELSAEDAAIEDEFADEVDDLDEVDDDEDDDGDRAVSGGSRTATKEKARPESLGKSKRVKEGGRQNIFMRLVNFVREVVAELRKVIWPTRKELTTYTLVVVVFVIVMLSIVGGLDYGFARLILWAFGDSSASSGE